MTGQQFRFADPPPVTEVEGGRLHEFLSCGSSWTESEKWVIKWQFGLLGDFQTALARAIATADDANLAALRLGFPMQVDGFLAWHGGDLGRRLREAGLEI